VGRRDDKAQIGKDDEAKGPMTRLRLRYVQAWVADGRAHHYFRRAGYPRVRLPGLPGSLEFMSAYQAALDSAMTEIGKDKRSKPGSVSAAIASYYASQSFRCLAASSQVVRKAVLEAFRREHGDKQIAAMPRKFLAALLDAMTPTTARNWFKAIRALTDHCIKVGMLRDDPTLGLKPRPIKGDGFHTWTDREIAQYEACHAIGSRGRLALALGLYTGQRRGDVIRMGRQHIREGWLYVTQQKTGQPLAIPVVPELAAVLDVVPPTQMTFLTTARGKPFDGKGFTMWFAKACAKAGLGPQCTFHGLRKAACRKLAEAGCTVHEIAAISGHASLKEVERYTKGVDQARLAQAAMARMVQEQTGTKTVKVDRRGLSKPLNTLEKRGT
jgi:integrase